MQPHISVAKGAGCKIYSSIAARRSFLAMGSKAALVGAAANTALLHPEVLLATSLDTPPSDRVRFALIGAGVRGCQLLQASLAVPGVECVAVADHQHRRVVVDACAAGKDVYNVEDGFAMMEAAQKNHRILQVGSQCVSFILYAKAREIYASGALGKVFAIEAYADRNSASRAWEYPIPPGANAQTIDWNQFLVGAPQRPFDAARFFRWSGYGNYGEGLPGGLYVHLLSGISFVAGINTVPSRAYSTGGIFRWKDGRDQPDLIETLYDYPNLRASLRCNLNNDAGELIAFYGTKGTLEIRGSTLTFHPQDTTPAPETYSIIGWPAKLRQEYLAQWSADHPQPSPPAFQVRESESYATPAHYNDVVDHEVSFFRAVRTRKAPVENEVFGNNMATGCHMANALYFQNAVATWDANTRQIRT